MSDVNDNNDANISASSPAFKLADLGWLLAIGVVMACSGIWSWLSPRPEVGQVAVLWLPNAVLFVAILRNWGRWMFCALACLVFMAVGLLPSFANDSVLSAIWLLSVDLAEVFIFVLIIVTSLGKNFRLTSALNIAVFSIGAAVACALGGGLAALVSQLSTGSIAVASKAPLQVGVAWFTSDLATYFFAAAPLLTLTGPSGARVRGVIKSAPVRFLLISLLVMALTLAGFGLPQWLARHTGLALGSGGLILIAFPLATFVAFRQGAAGASITGAAIGIPAIYATMAGFGPYGSGNAAANVFDMQSTLIVCTLTLLLIGGMADGMRSRTNALERALDEAIKMRQSRS